MTATSTAVWLPTSPKDLISKGGSPDSNLENFMGDKLGGRANLHWQTVNQPSERNGHIFYAHHMGNTGLGLLRHRDKCVGAAWLPRWLDPPS
jgi:hypothetical protein